MICALFVDFCLIFFLHIPHLSVLTPLISNSLLSLSICHPAAVSCKCCLLLLYSCGIDVGFDQEKAFLLTGFWALWIFSYVYYFWSLSFSLDKSVGEENGKKWGRYGRRVRLDDSSLQLPVSLVQTPHPEKSWFVLTGWGKLLHFPFCTNKLKSFLKVIWKFSWKIIKL